MPVATSGAEPSEPLGMSGRPTADILVHAEVSMPLYSFAIKVVPDRDMFSEEAAVWEKAIHKWLQVFDILGFPGMLGHALLSEQVDAVSGSRSAVLRDALGVKSPRTALKRAQTLLRYFSCCNQTVMNGIHGTERCAYSTWDRLELKCKLHQEALLCWRRLDSASM